MNGTTEQRACAIILAGGRGTRFWPRSRLRRPKQLLNLLGDETMLQQTVRRLQPLFPPERIWVVTHREQRAEVARQLNRIPRDHILAEPTGRNTAAAVALAAIHIRRAHGNVPVGIFPADHVVRDGKKFLRLARAALRTAVCGANSVVFGVSPHRPETGYGYIHRGKLETRLLGQSVYRVRRFTEKPSLLRARAYLRSKQYAWNSGMFFWTLDTFFANLERFLPATAAAFERLSAALGSRRYRTHLARVYPRLESISVDYAILERGENIFMIPCDVGWSDLGSWAAVYESLAERAGKNVTLGRLLAFDARGNLFLAPGKLVAAVGVDDLVLVETEDALLICHRERSQDVSQIVKLLERRKLHRYL